MQRSPKYKKVWKNDASTGLEGLPTDLPGGKSDVADVVMRFAARILNASALLKMRDGALRNAEARVSRFHGLTGTIDQEPPFIEEAKRRCGVGESCR